MIKRTRDEWIILVEKWKNSGKTMTAWCREYQIPKNTFIYWIKGGAAKKDIGIARDNFIELKGEEPKTCVLIEWRGCKIHLNRDISPLILEKCLQVIGKRQC